jgi:alginate O-acetyltransferase complex protein AlgI
MKTKRIAVMILCLALLVVMGGETLPLGVSFYTFQILSYMIDVYRRDIPAETSLLKLGTYIAMFPQLVSGPIVNYDEVSEALNKRKMTWKSVQNGLKVFTLGLASKVLIADRIGFLWNDIQMQGYESMSTALAWLGAIAFSFKIYFQAYYSVIL